MEIFYFIFGPIYGWITSKFINKLFGKKTAKEVLELNNGRLIELLEERNNTISELEIENKKKEIEAKYKEIEEQLRDNKVSTEQLYTWFKEEIERKDKEIERLKNDNHILFMTALKARQSQFDELALKHSTKSEKQQKNLR